MGPRDCPMKAHAGHEPVIPSASTMVIAVAGLEALGRPFGPEMVFRQEIFAAVTGAKSGEPLSVEQVAAIFCRPKGLFRDVPVFARKIAFLNKIDLLEEEREAEKLAEACCRTSMPASNGSSSVLCGKGNTGCLRDGVNSGYALTL